MTAHASGKGRRVILGYLFLVSGVALWAVNSLIARVAVTGDIPPIGFAWWRWIAALLMLLPFTRRGVWQHRHLILRRWRFFLGFSIVSVGCYNTFFYLGLQYTPVVQGALIQSVLPVLVLLLGFGILRESISARQWIGVALSLGGVVLILLRGDLRVINAMQFNEGDLWCLAAALVWAIQTFLIRWRPAEIPIMQFMTITIGIGIVCLAPVYVWEHSTGRTMPWELQTAESVFYVALFASVLGSSLYNEGTYRVGAATAGYFGNLWPVFSAGLAILILGEALAWYHVGGALAVFAGIWFATKQRAADGD